MTTNQLTCLLLSALAWSIPHRGRRKQLLAGNQCEGIVNRKNVAGNQARLRRGEFMKSQEFRERKEWLFLQFNIHEIAHYALILICSICLCLMIRFLILHHRPCFLNLDAPFGKKKTPRQLPNMVGSRGSPAARNQFQECQKGFLLNW